MLGRAVVRAIMREDDAGHTITLAFVVMPDHLHWLVQLVGRRSLSVSVNTAKSFAARTINKHIQCAGRIWQKGFYDRAIRRDQDLQAVARYVVANPLRAGLVQSLRDYPLWDAVWV
jgi:REP element-mobilizing transposase RayT